MVLAANFPLPSEGSGWLLGGGGGGTGSVPPQGQVQRLFGKQRLNQGQVQARHTAAVQHQDLVAGAQTCQEKTRLSGTGENTGGVGSLDVTVKKRTPSLKARPSGRTSLTQILLFFWLSMCPVTAKPDGK